MTFSIQTIVVWVLVLLLPPSATGFSTKATSPPKVLVVGGGIGGLSSAFDAKHNLQAEITVVSDHKHFYFTPSNPWVATRKRTPEDIRLPLTTILPRHNINFVHGKVVHLEPKAQQLQLDDGTMLSYDYLIIATGPRLAFDELPGSHGVSICTTSHAVHAAEQVDALEKTPGPIVVGCAAGASCFGPAYEFVLLLHHELEKRGGSKLLQACPMTFVTPEPYIGHLGLRGAGGSRDILETMLSQKGIESYTNCKVDNIASDHIAITKVDDANTKLKIPCRLSMIIPPFRGHAVWNEVSNLTDDKGMILVNEFQQSIAYRNIFGVGSCVSIPPLETTLVPTGSPKTGYMIESQGTAAVKNIRTLMDFAKQPNPKEGLPSLKHRPLLNGVCITDFGHSGAIFLTLPQYPPRRVDVTINGKVAVLAKIAFEKYFLHKIESGDVDPYYEKYLLHLIGVDRVTSID